MAKSRGSVIERTIKAILFMDNHKYWTIADLSDELEINKKNGRLYLIELSLQLPIVEVKPKRYGIDGVGLLPAVYSLNQSIIKGHK